MTTDRLLSLSAAALLFVIASAAPAGAQTPPPAATGAAAGASGHWTGTLHTPAQELPLEVDLKPGTPPAWIGTISVPAQNLQAFPLGAIEVQGKAVTFAMPGFPGSPTFKGQLSDDGGTITGEMTQGGGSLPLTLTRTGDAVIAPAPKSTAITKDVEGKWAGTLSAGGQDLHLTMTLANGADGATGHMVSVDQGAAEIPIVGIVQTGTHLELSLPIIAGKFAGDVKEGRLVGTWSQGPGSLPLEFSRVP